MNIFDIIEDLYVSKYDIQTILDSKADQADTYTKEQINANFYDIIKTYDKIEINSQKILIQIYF